MNRVLIFFEEKGFVALEDSPFRFLSSPPQRIGDHALILVASEKRFVQLLRSYGHIKDSTYIVG